MSDQSPCSTNFDQFLPDLPSIDSPSSSTAVPDASTSTSKPSTRKHHERPSACAVCGKPANGYHYEVASCNGCKTFFRRILISEKSFVCKLDKDCFDLEKREIPIKCRACRYLKCIALGMNPLAMKIDEVEAQAENFKKLSKRVIKTDDVDGDEAEETDDTSKSLCKMIFSVDERKEKMIDMLTYLEYKVDLFRKCAYNPNFEYLPGLETLLQEQNKISMADRTGPMPGWPLKQPKGPPPRGPMPQIGAKGGPKAKPPVYEKDKKMWFLYDLLTTVEYAKTFEFFHKLDMIDRIILLKSVTLAIMNLHISHYSVQKHFDRIIHPDGTVPPQAHGMVYSQSTMSISPLIRYSVSSKEYILLKAICLCNPAVPDLSKHAQDVILAERELYATALFDLCLRDSKLGPSHFAHLIGIIDTLEHQQKIQKDLHVLVMLPLVKNCTPMLLIGDIMEN